MPGVPGEAAAIASLYIEAVRQGQARDAGCRNEATGGGEPESLKVMVQLAPRGATFDARCARHRIDPHGFHE